MIMMMMMTMMTMMTNTIPYRRTKTHIWDKVLMGIWVHPVYDNANKQLVKWPLGRWRPDASRSRQTTANPAPMIRNFFNAIKIFRLHFLSVSCQTLHCFLSQYLLSFSQGGCRCLVALYIIWHCDLWGARGEDKRLVRCFESQGGAVSGTRQDLCTYSASRLL